MRRRATTLQFGVEIEDRALFHFGAASQGAPLPSTFIAYSKRAQPASHKQCVEARRRGVLARACAGCVHFPAPPYFNPHFSPPPLPSFLFLPSSLSSPSSLAPSAGVGSIDTLTWRSHARGTNGTPAPQGRSRRCIHIHPHGAPLLMGRLPSPRGGGRTSEEKEKGMTQGVLSFHGALLSMIEPFFFTFRPSSFTFVQLEVSESVSDVM